VDLEQAASFRASEGFRICQATVKSRDVNEARHNETEVETKMFETKAETET